MMTSGLGAFLIAIGIVGRVAALDRKIYGTSFILGVCLICYQLTRVFSRVLW
jgi:hypothetical protein